MGIIAFLSVLGIIGLLIFIISNNYIISNKKSTDKSSHTQPDIKKSHEQMSDLDNLATETYKLGKKIGINKSMTFLNKNEIAIVDSVIFSSYLVWLIIASNDRKEKYKDKLNEYLNSVKMKVANAGGCFKGGLLQKTVDEMFENRISFYHMIFSEKDTPDEAISAIIEEFEYIIKTDIINGKYIKFGKESPLPILGFDVDIICHIEASRFHEFALGHLDAYIQPILKKL